MGSAPSGLCASSRKVTPDVGDLRPTIMHSGCVIDNHTVSVSALTAERASLEEFEHTEEVKALIHDSLQGSFMFSEMENLSGLINFFRPVECQQGQVLIEQGDNGDYLYVVERSVSRRCFVRVLFPSQPLTDPPFNTAERSQYIREMAPRSTPVLVRVLLRPLNAVAPASDFR